MNTSDVLNKAADLIEERGWTQGQGWIFEDTSVAGDKICLEGGIQAAMGIRLAESAPDGQFAELYACPAYRAVSDYLGREHAGVDPSGITFTGQPLYWWNDSGDEIGENRTAAEVIEVLRACAVIEAAKENAETRQVVSA